MKLAGGAVGRVSRAIFRPVELLRRIIGPKVSSISPQAGGAPSSSAAAFGGKDPRASRRLLQEAIVDTRWFAIFMGCVVVVNVVTIGLETDLRDDSWPQLFSTINNFFLLAYICELVLRLLTHGMEALRDKLTVVDGLLVVVAFVERAVSNSGFARALPVFRLLRVLRLLQELKYLRSSRSLQVLIATSYHVVITLGWVALLLFVNLWSCASFTKHVIGDSAEWVGSMDPTVDHEPFSSFDNREYFGSVYRSFLTLLQVVTLAQWSNPVVRRVVEVYPNLFFFFFFFIFFTSFGLIMGVISNLVQDAMIAARVAEAAAEDLERDEIRRRGDQVLHILRAIDTNGDGELSAEELDFALANTNLKKILLDLNVPNLDGEGLVRLFDRDGNCHVTAEEIVDGLVFMDEEIRPRDFVRLSMWLWNLLMRARTLSEKLQALSEQVGNLRQALEKAFQASKYFLDNRESAELRGRAIKAIRSAPPGEAPSLRGSRDSQEPLYPPEDQAQLFLGFAKRFLGTGRVAGASGGELGHGLRDAAFVRAKVELPPAPSSFSVAKAQAREADRSFQDKYSLEHDPQRGGVLSPSASLVRLRELLT